MDKVVLDTNIILDYLCAKRPDHLAAVDLMDASSLDGFEPDFEDAIVQASAELMGARAIVTRDAAAFQRSRIPSIDAKTFCYSLKD